MSILKEGKPVGLACDHAGYETVSYTHLGQRYNFQFYLFTEELKNTVVTAALLDCEEQIVVSKNFHNLNQEAL